MQPKGSTNTDALKLKIHCSSNIALAFLCSCSCFPYCPCNYSLTAHLQTLQMLREGTSKAVLVQVAQCITERWNGEDCCITPPSNAHAQAAEEETQPGLLHIAAPKEVHYTWANRWGMPRPTSMGLFAFQLLGPCLSRAGHLDIITLYVLVLF